MRFTKTNPASKTPVLLLCASFDSLAPARLALRANLRLLYLALTLALGCGEVAAADDPFKDLASTLGKDTPGEKVNIDVGSFNYENTDLQ